MEDEEKLQFLGGNFQLHFHALEYKNMTKMFFFSYNTSCLGVNLYRVQKREEMVTLKMLYWYKFNC